MTLRAYFDVNGRGSRARLKLIAAGALNHQLAIRRMQIGLHLFLHVGAKPFNLDGLRAASKARISRAPTLQKEDVSD